MNLELCDYNTPATSVLDSRVFSVGVCACGCACVRACVCVFVCA